MLDISTTAQPDGEGAYPSPLLLWGLTLGILADFLDMLPPHQAVQLWKYPTFTVSAAVLLGRAPDLTLSALRFRRL
jgi:hypothetical protein